MLRSEISDTRMGPDRVCLSAYAVPRR